MNLQTAKHSYPPERRNAGTPERRNAGTPERFIITSPPLPLWYFAPSCC